MQDMTQTLDEVKDLYQKVLGQPAPEIEPNSYVSFPPGVDPLHHVVDEVQQLKQLSEQFNATAKPITWVPRADCFLMEDAYEISLEIPGVDRGGLKVFVHGGECVVRGERKAPQRTRTLQPLTLERPWGEFERRFVLPVGSDPDRITARYADGVLQVRVALERSAMPKEMKVEVG